MSPRTSYLERAVVTDQRSIAKLTGSFLGLARLAWLILVAAAIGLYLISIPAIYDVTQNVCLGQECPDWRLSPESATALRSAGISLETYALVGTIVSILSMGVFVSVAALIVWRRTHDGMALFVSFFLVMLGAQLSGLESLSEAQPGLWIAVALVGYLAWSSLLPFVFLFPNGSFVPRWTLWVAAAWIIIEFPFWFSPGSSLDSETWHPLASGLTYLGFLGSLLFAQIYRYVRVSSALERQQTKWVVFGLTAAVAILAAVQLPGALAPERAQSGSLNVFYELIGVTLIPLAFLLVPVTIGISILRYRLWDIDVVINRTLVYATLTACVVGIYVLSVGYLGELLRTGNNLLVSLVTTGIVAVLFQPLRERVQRGVNRLMYGERDEPYRVLTRLGERLESTLAPDAVLPVAAQTVKEALKLSYTAIEIQDGDDFRTAAVSGTPSDDSLRLPLTYQGETVGRLTLGPRTGEETFTPADRRLLDDLARQIGVAVHAVSLAEDARRLSEDLQRSRERLVTAREEERRRLRRDLHDGLGPQLASLTMKAEAARDLQETDPEGSNALLNDLVDQTQNAVADVRRLVYALRPPALDALGLIGALRSHVNQLDHTGTRVTIEAPDSLPPLPAAVEVAAYRIVLEALNNVVRHADAHSCLMRITFNEENAVIDLDIVDDGTGIPDRYVSGVGLASMRERAEELGGHCNVERSPAGGTLVHARLPYLTSEPIGGEG